MKTLSHRFWSAQISGSNYISNIGEKCDLASIAAQETKNVNVNLASIIAQTTETVKKFEESLDIIQVVITIQW